MTWHVPPGVASCTDDDGVVWVLSTEHGRIVRLDEVSALIWAAADGANRYEEVVTTLANENGWAPAEIGVHVEHFLNELTACGLLGEESA